MIQLTGNAFSECELYNVEVLRVDVGVKLCMNHDLCFLIMYKVC